VKKLSVLDVLDALVKDQEKDASTFKFFSFPVNREYFEDEELRSDNGKIKELIF